VNFEEHAMKFEVEQKFPVSDAADVERRLAELGTAVGPPVAQADLYYAHPSRDFAQTDEALRIRRIGEGNLITYKGAKIDATTKTRREIELPLADGDESAARWGELLEALGFRAVTEVRKLRRTAEITWDGFHVEAALDEVKTLGSFVELEISVEEPDVEAARRALAALATRLNLGPGERRSYLELLLGKNRPPSAVG
jgi:adenylate cyclase, class 2